MSALIREQIVDRLNASDPSRKLTITPLLDREKQIGAGSVDLRLGSEFLEASRQATDFVDPFRSAVKQQAVVEDRRTHVPLGNRFVLHPGQFVLGSTLEFIVMPADMTGQVLSRSSWGRVGLLVATAVAVQPGFRGMLTLELVNSGSQPIVLHPGLRVAQLQLWESSQPTAQPYSVSGKYDAPLGPETNRLVVERGERDVLRHITENLHPGHAEE
jgi:dCTP deaminase